ncbi:MAG TPA: hypothetical protein VGL56_14560 [Fimbriimonadaceae bacterium]
MRKYLRENWLALGCFLVGVLLVWGQLQYPSHWLNEWDESQLINSGRMLAHGHMPVYALSPFLAFFYLPFFELFKHNQMWLFDAATWGHRVLFLGLWGVLWLIGREILPREQRVAILVWPIVTSAFAGVVANSSDAAFTIMSGLAFWQLMQFRMTLSYKNAAWMGFFLGLSALCRADGLLLTVLSTIILVSILYQRDKLKLGGPLLGALLLPAIAVIGMDLGLQHKLTGQSYLGLKPRSYVAFEQGQGVVYADQFKDQNPMSAGLKWSQKLYGPATKNDNSIFKAFTKNPQAFTDRMTRQVKQAPRQAIDAYSDANINQPGGIPITGIAFLMAVVAGGIFLVRERQKGLATICLVWTSFLFVYLITFYRPGYFLTVCFPLFVLAGFGFVWVIQSVEAMFPKTEFAQYLVAVPALVLGLVAGITRGIPSPRTYAASEGEIRLALTAINHAAPNGSVVSSAPQIAFLAQKQWVDPSSAPQEPGHFKTWAQKNSAHAMVIDGRLQYDDPELYTALSKLVPKLGQSMTPSAEDIKVYKLPNQAVVAAKETQLRVHKHRRKKKRHRRK